MRPRTAVIPAAGLGTRFLPITKAVPKELVPIVDRPGLQVVIEEALGAGIERIVVVSHPSKSAVEQYFTPNDQLLASLVASGKDELASTLRALDELDVRFVQQLEPRGLGHAVGMAAAETGDEAFVVLLPDELMGGPGLLSSMIAIHEANGGSVIGLMEVERHEVTAYGVADPIGEVDGSGVVRLRGMVEKPSMEEAPSRLICVGRYVCTAAVMDEIGRLQPGRNGEYQLTDALQAAAGYEPFHGQVGSMLPAGSFRRHDTGTPAGWMAANIELALRHPVYGAEMRAIAAAALSEAG